MTVWSGPRIAKWLTEAGLPADQIVHAVSLAMAATSGADHYRHNVTSNPATERRGLYAVSVSETSLDSPADLNDPAKASRDLVDLFQKNGDRWDWHPVHLSGAALALEPVTAMSLGDPSAPQGHRNVADFGQSIDNLLQMRKAIRWIGPDRVQ